MIFIHDGSYKFCGGSLESKPLILSRHSAGYAENPNVMLLSKIEP